MSEYRISPIQEYQMNDIIQAAKNAFGWGVGLIIPKKKVWGFYAHDNDNVVGAVFIKKLSDDEGVLDWIFVDPIAQGHRLGALLMDQGLAALEDAGLKKQFALVRDDNTASWNMFAKRGYKEPSLFYTMTQFSFKSMLYRQFYAMVAGYSIWVKDDRLADYPMHPKKRMIVKTLLFSLFLGSSLSLFSLRGLEYFMAATVMVFSVTLVRIIVSFPFARLSGPVRFDAPQGGLILSALLGMMGTWWPTFGSFVPKKDIWDIRNYAKYDIWAQFFAWMSLLGLYVLSYYFIPELFTQAVQFYLMFIIIIQGFPFFPLDGMQGARIYRFNKGLYMLSLLLTVLIFVTFN